jgi:hypothetical protein
VIWKHGKKAEMLAPKVATGSSNFRAANRALDCPKIPCGNFDGTQGSKEGEIASIRRTGPNVLPFENGCKSAVKVEKRALDDTGAFQNGGADGNSNPRPLSGLNVAINSGFSELTEKRRELG